MKIGIIGAGSFGTTLGHIWSLAGHNVTIWAREPEVERGINVEHRNPLYHSEVILHHELKATANLSDCLTNKDILVLAVPAKFLRAFIQSLLDAWAKAKLRSDIPLISVVKGFLLDPTELVSNLINKSLRSVGEFKWLQFAGPNISYEIIRGKPCASVLACNDMVVASSLQSELSTQSLRIYTSRDTIGVETCGAIKNVIAIACGMASGLGLGDNAKAVLITRGLLELKRIVKLLGGEPETVNGLSGLGDLVVTGFSEKSRNYQLGIELAQGKSLQEIEQLSREVAEGARTVKAVVDLVSNCQSEVEIPIINEVYQVIYQEKKPTDAISSLMRRPFKAE